MKTNRLTFLGISLLISLFLGLALTTAVALRNRSRRHIIYPILFILIALVTLFGSQRAQIVKAAVDCNASSWAVSSETDVNDAIACFNAKSAGSYTITLAQNIDLTASLNSINNTTAGTTLLIDGADFTVDGQEIAGVLPFKIAGSTTVTMQKITITGANSNFFGGGIQNRGTLTINNSNISDNKASHGAGIESFLGILTINDSTISNNIASNSGGGLYAEKTTLTISNSTVNGNKTTSFAGGGIDIFKGTLIISNSTISNNEASSGGGIYNIESTTTISNSIISSNLAANGAGLYNVGGSTATISNSTISGNDTTNNGGGIYNNNGTITMTNSTISGNTAVSGGGILNDASLTLASSTISNNSATSSGGGIENSSPLTITNSIIANSTSGGDCVTSTSLTDNGYNLIEDSGNACGLTNGTNNNIVGQDPNLGSLHDNNGPTFTHALLAGSPAIDVGNSAAGTDQRGVSRPQGSQDDIGAFEVYSCNGSSWSVATSSELDVAIDCFNEKASGSYTITLAQNINLPTSSSLINNAGVTLTIEGGGFTVDGQDISGVRLFDILAGNVTIQNITLTGGNGPANWGGAIINWATLTLINSTISNNLGLNGGGIYNGGILNVITSTIRDNSADNGGGLYNNGGGILTIDDSTLDGNAAGGGGGLYNNGGTVMINSSTLSKNIAEPSFGLGGGIYADQGMVTIINSTLSGNKSAWNGGGIATGSNTSILIQSSSIISNTADYDDTETGNGGGISAFDTTVYTVTNSIIANNHDGTGSGSGGEAPDCAGITISGSGGIYSQGHNLIGTTTGCPFNSVGSDILNANALVGSLQDNGGFTFTHALLTGSPAIDAGDSAEFTDQRFVNRPQGSADDIGAFELYDCAVQPRSVQNELELNTAIGCFNAKTTAGPYTISVEADIDLIASSHPISNTTANVSLTIEGNGFTVDGQGILEVRPFEIVTETTTTMQNINITGGNISMYGVNGGGILNSGTLTVSNSVIHDNMAYSQSGGIQNDGILTIVDSTIRNNTANNSGGIHNDGILTISDSEIHDNDAGDGGGIYNAAPAELTINNSTIYSNTALYGGGIQNRSLLTITNSTISHNDVDALGGGIYNAGGTMSVSSSTINNNSATEGGGVYNDFGTIIFSNTIIANSVNGGDCVLNTSSTLTDQGHNLIEDANNACGLVDGVNSNIIGQDPNLGSLQDNGGPTFTHALLIGSPAIDAGDCSGGPATDQRGVARSLGAACDIGAFEFNVFLLTVNHVGSGSVTQNPIQADYEAGMDVEITAISNSGWSFASWSGDLSGSTNPEIVTISGNTIVTATFSNDAPTADAGNNQAVLPSELVTLDGSDSSDDDPAQTLSYSWVQTGGLVVVLDDETAVSPTFTAPAIPTELTFELTVTDNLGRSSSPSEVIVTVTDEVIGELTAVSSSPTTLGKTTFFTATLSTGSNVVYSWDFGDGQSGSGSTISHTYGAVGDYTATVTATNSSVSQSATTSVFVVNDPPTADAGSDQVVSVSQLVTLDGSGSTDADGHLPLSYSWVQTGGLAVVFDDETAVSPTFTAPAIPTELTFELTVTDNLGRSSSPSEVVVTVESYWVFLPMIVNPAD